MWCSLRSFTFFIPFWFHKSYKNCKSRKKEHSVLFIRLKKNATFCVLLQKNKKFLAFFYILCKIMICVTLNYTTKEGSKGRRYIGPLLRELSTLGSKFPANLDLSTQTREQSVPREKFIYILLNFR